jgi:hypothetical protein
MKISRQLKSRLRSQLGCTTDATFRAALRNLTQEQYDEQLARAQAAA